MRTVWSVEAIGLAEELLGRIEAGATVQRRDLAALAHAALELPHVLLARDVLHQKGPLAIKRAIELAELILSCATNEKSEGAGAMKSDDRRQPRRARPST